MLLITAFQFAAAPSPPRLMEGLAGPSRSGDGTFASL
eukprot:COSAG06_NODE_28954_length_565_cov_0.673820_2_plen_36_part_01